MSTPTHETYDELEQAYSFFNEALFEGQLPLCLITLQRSHDSKGYFSPNQFVNRKDAANAHEISLNPKWFAVRSMPETLSTLVEGMVSLDRHLNYETPPRRRYRDKHWADKAEDIGLMPTDTGEPGGKRTGDKVKTYIDEGGPFDLACTELLEARSFVLSWLDRFPPIEAANSHQSGDLDIQLEHVAASAPANTFSDGAMLLAPVGDDDIDELDLSAGEASPADNAGGEGGSADTANFTLAIEQDGVVPESAPAIEPDTEPKGPPMKAREKVNLDSLMEMGVDVTQPAKNLSKSKFNCPDCNANAWGRPSLKLWCGGVAENTHDVIAMLLIQS